MRRTSQSISIFRGSRLEELYPVVTNKYVLHFFQSSFRPQMSYPDRIQHANGYLATPEVGEPHQRIACLISGTSARQFPGLRVFFCRESSVSPPPRPQTDFTGLCGSLPPHMHIIPSLEKLIHLVRWLHPICRKETKSYDPEASTYRKRESASVRASFRSVFLLVVVV